MKDFMRQLLSALLVATLGVVVRWMTERFSYSSSYSAPSYGYR